MEWFVLSPYLGGSQSAVTRRDESSSFAHRDLRIVWELYAKDLLEERSKPLELVGLVKGMAHDLGSPEAVCEFGGEVPR